jgi:hypothetical protein
MDDIDLNHYTWRTEWEDGPSLVVPCSNPNDYEYPADGIFSTVDEAIRYRDEWIEDGHDCTEWVLVKFVGNVVPIP